MSAGGVFAFSPIQLWDTQAWRLLFASVAAGVRSESYIYGDPDLPGWA